MESASRETELEKREPERSSSDDTQPDQAEPAEAQQPVLLAADPPADQEQQWVSGFKLLSIMTAITFPCFLLLLDTSIVVTAIPVITTEFHSLPDVGWYGAAYMISSAVLQPLTGKLYMNFDTKWTFLAFFAVFELGSLLCGAATSSKMLIVGRAIAGIGASGILNGAFTIIAGCVPMPRRPALIGFVSGISQLGLVLGPLLGGALTEYTTWRWCFYINLPIGGLVVLLIAFVHVPDQFPKPAVMTAVRTLHSTLDLIGFAIFAPAAVQLLLALQYGGNTFAWNSAQIIGLFCGAGGTFIVFLAWDYYKGDDAMIPFSIARRKSVWASCLTYAFFMGQVYCVSYYLPIYFQGVKGASPMMSGVYILPVIITHVIFSLSSGALMGRVGYYLPFIIISTILVAIGNGLLSSFSPDTSTGKWIGYQIILGAGRGLGLQVPIVALQNSLPPSQISVAMALAMFGQALAGALFLSLSNTIFSNSLKNLIPEYAPAVDAQPIIDAGATGLQTLVRGSDLAGVLVAFSKSVDRVYYFTAGLAVLSFAFSWFMGNKDVRKKQEVSEA